MKHPKRPPPSSSGLHAGPGFWLAVSSFPFLGLIVQLDQPHLLLLVYCLSLLPARPLLASAFVLDCCEKDYLAEGDELAHDQPDVDHLDS